MKRRFVTVCCFFTFVGCGRDSAPSVAAVETSQSLTLTSLTVDDLAGNYIGAGILGTDGACQVTIRIVNKGIVAAQKFEVQVNGKMFSTTKKYANTILAKVNENSPNLLLSTSVRTGILSSVDSTLQITLQDNEVTSLHYQSAAFNSGFIQGQWTVLDCGHLVRN